MFVRSLYRSRVRAVTLLALAAGLALAVAAPAWAGFTDKYAGELGAVGGGYGPGEFGSPMSIAVDSSNGDVFVAQQWSGIQVLAPDGAFVTSWDGSHTPSGYFAGVYGVAVDAGNDRVYVTEQYNGAVDVFTRSGGYVERLVPPGGSYGWLAGVAVDSATGEVYVVDQGMDAVDVFDAAGAYVTSFGSPGSGEGQLSGPSQVAVDPVSHEVFVVDAGNGRVERFTAAGAYAGVLAAGAGPASVTVDPADEDVYVGEEAGGAWQIVRYDTAGDRLYGFYPHDFLFYNFFTNEYTNYPHQLGSLAASATGHMVYALDNYAGFPSGLEIVQVFGPVTVPDVTTEGASGVEATSVTLAGTVDPLGSWAGYYFEYGLTTGYGSNGGYGWLESGSPAAQVTGVLYGLEPNATYHYRLAAYGPNGTGYGLDRTFTTLAAPPAIEGGMSWNSNPNATWTVATPVSATVYAQINANNSPTSYHVEYGLTGVYESSTASVNAGSWYGLETKTDEVTGLQPDTVYHYRVVADNGVGAPVASADRTFKTPSAAPPTASGVTGTSATLNGVVGPEGATATYKFEYGTSTSYGSSTGEQGVEDRSGGGSVPVSVPVSGLAPGTVYHFRLVWTSPNGNSTVTSDGTFTTMTPAAVTTGQPSQVASRSAVLHGTIDTYGQAATYSFTVTGVGSSVVRFTESQPVTSEGPVEVSAVVGELPPGGEYQATLTATVGGVQSFGEPVTFTTPADQPLLARSIPAETPYTNSSSSTSSSGSASGVAAGPPFTILSARGKGAAATVTVSVPGAGRLAVRGSSLRAASKTEGKAGVYTLHVRLSKQAAKKLAHSHRLTVLFTVTFTPTSGTVVKRQATVTFKRGAKR